LKRLALLLGRFASLGALGIDLKDFFLALAERSKMPDDLCRLDPEGAFIEALELGDDRHLEAPHA